MSPPLRILITAGSTREPIDAVRFIGNRSSGKMGAALAAAALHAGHSMTLIAGPIAGSAAGSTPVPFPTVRRIDVETAQQMLDAVLAEFPNHDLLIMAAAVADFRPLNVSSGKLARSGSITIECEPTSDIVAAASSSKRPDQQIVAFSLEADGDVERAREKMRRKGADWIVYNALPTMGSDDIRAIILSAAHPDEGLPQMPKDRFAAHLIDRVTASARQIQSPRGRGG